MNIVRRFATTLAVVALITAAVPSAAEQAAAKPTAATPSASAQVNVNTATAEELALLPSIGPATAQRIVEHREKNGAFKQVDDLLLVKGIGEKTFSGLQPYVALSGKTSLTSKVKLARAAAKP